MRTAQAVPHLGPSCLVVSITITPHPGPTHSTVVAGLAGRPATGALRRPVTAAVLAAHRLPP